MKNGIKRVVMLVVLFATTLFISGSQDEQLAIAAPPSPSISVMRPVATWASSQVSSLRVPVPTKTHAANSASAPIAVNFIAQGSHNAYGDICLVWPEQAKNSLNYAVSIWASLIQSPLPIRINACWTSLDSKLLGFSGALSFHRDFSGSIPGYVYPVALANAISQTDLNDTDGIDWDGDGLDADAEIDISVNANASWYTGSDGNPSPGTYDLVTVGLHEMAHGLGLSSWMYFAGGQGSWGLGTGYPTIFDRFVENGAGENLITNGFFNPSEALGSQLISNNIYFGGADARAANGNNQPKLYAPRTWRYGSSISHLDEIYDNTPNALMTYSLGYQEVIHDPGPISLGILSDLGWTASAECYTLTWDINPMTAGSIMVQPVPNCEGNKYLPLTSVTLTASPISGFRFLGWAGDTSPAASTSLIMTENKNIRAVFGSVSTTIFLPLVSR